MSQEFNPEQKGQSHQKKETPVAQELAGQHLNDLSQYVEDNHLEIKPIRDAKGVLKEYEVRSRGNKQLFIISPDDMEFAIVQGAILGANADREEIVATMETIHAVQNTLKKLGLNDEEIPRKPDEIAQMVIDLLGKFQTIQERKSAIDVQNTFQEFLAMARRVYAGGKKEYNNLPAALQVQLGEFYEFILVEAAKKIGVDDETVKTAERIREISEQLTNMRREASGWVAAGKALDGLTTGAVKLVVDKEKGIIPGVVRVAGEITGGIVDKTGEVIQGTVDGIRERRKEDIQWKEERKKEQGKK